MKNIDDDLAREFFKGREEAFKIVKSICYRGVFNTIRSFITYSAAARLIADDVFEELWKKRIYFKNASEIYPFLRQRAKYFAGLFILCYLREIDLGLGKTDSLLYSINSPLYIPLYDSERVAKGGIIDKYTTMFFHLNINKKMPLEYTAKELGITPVNLGKRILVALTLLHSNFLAYVDSAGHNPNIPHDN